MGNFGNTGGKFGFGVTSPEIGEAKICVCKVFYKLSIAITETKFTKPNPAGGDPIVTVFYSTEANALKKWYCCKPGSAADIALQGMANQPCGNSSGGDKNFIPHGPGGDGSTGSQLFIMRYNQISCGTCDFEELSGEDLNLQIVPQSIRCNHSGQICSKDQDDLGDKAMQDLQKLGEEMFKVHENKQRVSRIAKKMGKLFQKLDKLCGTFCRCSSANCPKAPKLN